MAKLVVKQFKANNMQIETATEKGSNLDKTDLPSIYDVIDELGADTFCITYSRPITEQNSETGMMETWERTEYVEGMFKLDRRPKYCLNNTESHWEYHIYIDLWVFYHGNIYRIIDSCTNEKYHYLTSYSEIKEDNFKLLEEYENKCIYEQLPQFLWEINEQSKPKDKFIRTC